MFRNTRGFSKAEKSCRWAVRKKFPRHPKVPDHAPKALIFSPHPDDECIVGGLALRLLREAKWNVINVAVTLGSKKERRAERLRELKDACDFLGFDLAVADWEDINPAARRKNRAAWRAAVRTIAEILAEQRPRVIFIPHECDGHPARTLAPIFWFWTRLKLCRPVSSVMSSKRNFGGTWRNPICLSNPA